MKKTCDCCGKKFEEDELTEIDEDFVCDDCFDEHYILCDGCEQYVHEDFVKYISGKELCDSCCDRETFICNECGAVFLKEEGVETRFGWVDNDCFSERFEICDECGEVFPREDMIFSEDSSYCSNCYESMIEDLGVHDHNYKPIVFFHQCEDESDDRTDNLHVGIELEIQGDDRDKFCHSMIDEYDDEFIFYMKEDGSLDDFKGVEIVSQPMSYNFIRDSIHFKKLFEFLNKHQMNNTDNCGLHFHLDREYCEKEGRNISATIDCMINVFAEFFEEFGGRKFNSFCKKNENKHLCDFGKKNYSRYYAVNFDNSETIELRFCASTDDYDTFINRVKMIFTIVFFAQKYNLNAVYKMTKDEFVRKFKRIYKKHFESNNN